MAIIVFTFVFKVLSALESLIQSKLLQYVARALKAPRPVEARIILPY